MYRFVDHGGHLCLSLSIQSFPVELLKKRISACVITGESSLWDCTLGLHLWDWWLKVVLPPPHAKRNKVSPRNVAFVD